MAYMGIDPHGDHETRLQALTAGFADFDARLERIEVLTVRILEAVESQGRHVGSIDQQVAGIDQRLTGIDRLVEGVAQRLTSVEQHVTGMDQRLTGVERLLTDVNRLVRDMDQRLTVVESRLTGIESRLDRAENRQDITDGRLANIEKILGEHSVMHHKHDLNFQTAAVTADFTLREAKGITDRQLALERDLRRFHWIAFGVAASAAGALALGRGH